MRLIEILRHPNRLALWTAVAGTIFIAIFAFVLSFHALADLARRSGISAAQAWMWPLIVDGIIVVATVSAVALAGSRASWYPWMMLAAGAAMSVTANAIHALVAADADVPHGLAASVAAVPPTVLLAITHLTVVLTRRDRMNPSEQSAVGYEEQPIATASDTPALGDPRQTARRLRADGLSNRAIAQATGVHPSTVGRWFAAADSPTTLESEVD